MFRLQTGPGYNDLNAIRDCVLRLPLNHPLRRRYRELRRALANIQEDISITLTSTADVRRVERSIRELQGEVENI